MNNQAKRRKDRFNPYRLNRTSDGYIIKIRNDNEEQVIVNEKIYNEMNKFELEDLSQMNKYDRHIEHFSLNDEQINRRRIDEVLSAEDLAIHNIENERIYMAVLKLPKKQKERIIMYYFRNMSQKEIARKEKISIRAIQYSLNIALKNLKKFLD